MRPDHGALRRSAALLLLSLWVCGCDVTAPPSGARRFTPRAQYRAWWALTEACSGLRGNFDAVSWYLYRGGDVFVLEGTPVNAAWYEKGNRIVLGASEELNGSLVRHECCTRCSNPVIIPASSSWATVVTSWPASPNA